MHFSKALLLYRNVNVGGSETLLLRISKEMVLDKCEVVLICRTIDAPIKKQFEDVGVIVNINETDSDKIIEKEIASLDDNSIFLSLSVNDFLMCERVRKKHQNRCKNILYVVHPFTLFASDSRHGVLQRIKRGLMKVLYKKPINLYLENGNIVFMDEQCYRHSMTFYGFGDNYMNTNILHLPINITEIEDNWLDEKCKSRNIEFNILTVARAAFPFKGYMKGLIDIYSECNLNWKLTIISERDQFETLKLWVDEANAGLETRIELIRGVSYDNLIEYYNKCHVYIGMGTTILEAADKGAVCIPVAPYTYECKATQLFSEDPDSVAIESDQGTNVKSLLLKLKMLNDDDFLKLMYASRISLIENYSANSFITVLFNREVKKDVFFINAIMNWFVLAQNFGRKYIKKG